MIEALYLAGDLPGIQRFVLPVKSAGVTLTPYRVPVRHAVERAEQLLETAKGIQERTAAPPWEPHAITFIARCESGLHIGGPPDELVIGGSDNPVIKNPATGQPYVPGSSLKGKMRAELEKQLGKSGGRNGEAPCGCGEDSCAVCRLFGAHVNTKELAWVLVTTPPKKDWQPRKPPVTE